MLRRITRRLTYRRCTCGEVELILIDIKVCGTKHRLNKPCYIPLKKK